jgi:PQQ-dependent catabolism-associated CXXCW motif protein
MPWRNVIAAIACLLSSCATQPIHLAPPVPNTRQTLSTYDNETQDFGVAPTTIIRTGDFFAPTPTQINGAKTITTPQLQSLIKSDATLVLIDVSDGRQGDTLPSAIWLRGAGLGNNPYDQTQELLSSRLLELTHGNQGRAIVFFCSSNECWLSHNAVVRAVKLGYPNIYWYRGGRRAWLNAGLPLRPKPVDTFSRITRPITVTARAQSTAIQPANGFDGVYGGFRRGTKTDGRDACTDLDRTIQVAVEAGTISYRWSGVQLVATVAADGSFSARKPGEFGAVVSFSGRFNGDGLEADLGNAYCAVHMSLKRM